jgi:hypothetical protein
MKVLYYVSLPTVFDKIEKNEMSGSCSSDGERHVQGFGGET